MMRWLSQLWLSALADRGRTPSALWRMTFGRFKTHRDFAARLTGLDAQLKHDAASQQQTIAQQTEPIGHYHPRTGHSDPAPPRWAPLLKPAMTAVACVLVAAVVWSLWPDIPRHHPNEIQHAFADSYQRLKDPLTEQMRLAGLSLREQTDHVRKLPEKLPPIDKVVNDLGEAIQTPIREEVRRFTRDMTEPWVYFASQLPMPVRQDTDEPTGSGA